MPFSSWKHQAGGGDAGLTVTSDRASPAMNFLNAACMVSGLRKGEVGCSSISESIAPYSFSYQSNACSTTSTDPAESVANSGGRNQGACAPQVRAISAIAGSSVDTNTSAKILLSSAATIVHAMRGLSPNGSMFFPGNRLDPPRAGISANSFNRHHLFAVRPRSHSGALRPAKARASGTPRCAARRPGGAQTGWACHSGRWVLMR